MKQILSISSGIRRWRGGACPRHAARGSLGKSVPADGATCSGATRRGLAWTAWVAVLLPLAALVFALTVLAVKAWPAIRVNGW